MAKKVYLSGPITGHPNYQAFFAEHEADLANSGYEVMNPAKLDDPDNPPPWHECVIRDLGYVALCDIVALLPGWHQSHGARIEAMFAIKMGKRFIVRPGAAFELIMKLKAAHQPRDYQAEEYEEELPWGDEDELDDIDEKGFLEDGLDDIPGWS